MQNKVTGRLYGDNLCFFQCLALHDRHTLRHLEKATKEAFQKYRAAGLTEQPLTTFNGVTLENVHDAEQGFEKLIFVYSMVPGKVDDEDDDN